MLIGAVGREPRTGREADAVLLAPGGSEDFVSSGIDCLQRHCPNRATAYASLALTENRKRGIAVRRYCW